MSINHKSADQIVIIALENRNPNHITINTFLSIAKFINNKTENSDGLDEIIETKNGTGALADIVRIFSSTESVSKMKSLITLAVKSNPDLDPEFNPRKMLKGRAADFECYFKKQIISADGGLNPSNTGNSILSTQRTTPRPPTKNLLQSVSINPFQSLNVTSTSAEKQGSTTKSAGTINFDDPMLAWFKLQFDSCAKDSQIKTIENKMDALESKMVSKTGTLEDQIDEIEASIVPRIDIENQIVEAEQRVTESVHHELEIVPTESKIATELATENARKLEELIDQIKNNRFDKPALSEYSILGAATCFNAGNKLYWKQINFMKRSGIFSLIIKDEKLYKTESIDDEDVYTLNFSRLTKVLKLKFTDVPEFKKRMSKSSNLVAKCRIIGKSPSDTHTKVKKMIDDKHLINKYVHIALITPDEFDISEALDQWVELGSAIRYDVTKAGGVTVLINDGVTLPRFFVRV